MTNDIRYYVQVFDRIDGTIVLRQTMRASDEATCHSTAVAAAAISAGANAFQITRNDGIENVQALGRYGSTYLVG